jgi:ABC-type Zn uptake system ZnuABC Zn-binding protein ZnuA
VGYNSQCKFLKVCAFKLIERRDFLKRFCSAFCAAALLAFSLTGCGSAPVSATTDGFSIAATTYPVYLLASAVIDGVDGVTVEAVVNQSVACVHDYTLTIQNMKVLEGADLILLSGAGLEDFMDDAIQGKTTADCSEGISLLEGEDGEDDPHIWMDPDRAAIMAENIAQALADADPEHGEQYLANGQAESESLRTFAQDCKEELKGLSCRSLITFHEGFTYFADAFDLEILAAVEEEAGSEASAKQIVEMVDLIEENQLPVIFVEENGSDATAKAIQRECGVELASLSMIMSGPEYDENHTYETYLQNNIDTLKEVLG